MSFSQEFVDRIKNSKDPDVRYKDARALDDIRHMMRSSAQLFGDNTAFWHKKTKGGPYVGVSYKTTLEDMNSLGTAFVDLGLKDKKIAVIGENSYKWAISYLAAVCGCGVVVPLDKELNRDELKQLVEAAEVSCVCFQDKYEDVFTWIRDSGAGSLKHLVSFGVPKSEGVISWDELKAQGASQLARGDRRFLDAEIDPTAMSIILFTSGTTGISKGVMLSHRNIITDIVSAATVFQVRSDDIFFSVLPVHHTYECSCGFLLPLYKGAAIAYCEGLKYIVSNMQEVRPTVFLAVPILLEGIYTKIWKGAKKQGKDGLLRKVLKINAVTKKFGLDLGDKFFKDIRNTLGGRMRITVSGGAAINPEVLKGLNDFGIKALQGYGLTECAPIGALNPDTAVRYPSIGKALPNFDMKVVDVNEEGIGEICLTGDNLMLGYYNMPEETAEVLYDGWFHTGDMGYMDRDGYAYITGRKKNVIIAKNGKNVYPEEIEYYLSNVPYVMESFVFSEPTEDGEDDVIVASIRVDEDEVRAALGKDYTEQQLENLLWSEVDKINEKSPFFKRIKKVKIRKEEFVKNTSKKIKRFAEENRM